MRPLSMWMSVYGQWGEAAPPARFIPAGGQPAAGAAAGGMAAGAPPLLLRGHHGQHPEPEEMLEFLESDPAIAVAPAIS